MNSGNAKKPIRLNIVRIDRESGQIIGEQPFDAYCEKCSTSVKYGDDLCPKCGTEIDWSESPEGESKQ